MLVSPYLLVAVFALIYVALILPQNRRKKQALALRRQVEVGSRVMLTSGLYGTIVELDDDTIVIEASEGVEMRYAKAAVLRVIPDEPDTDDTDDTDDDHADHTDQGALDGTPDRTDTGAAAATRGSGTMGPDDVDPDAVARPSNREADSNGNGEPPGSVPTS
jgi:preprotein translocase subunit YajC